MKHNLQHTDCIDKQQGELLSAYFHIIFIFFSLSPVQIIPVQGTFQLYGQLLNDHMIHVTWYIWQITWCLNESHMMCMGIMWSYTTVTWCAWGSCDPTQQSHDVHGDHVILHNSHMMCMGIMWSYTTVTWCAWGSCDPTQQSHDVHGDHVILHSSHMMCMGIMWSYTSHMTYLMATMMKNRIPRATYPTLLHTLLKALQVTWGLEYNLFLHKRIQIVMMQEVLHKKRKYKNTKMLSLHTPIHAILILGLRPS